MEWQAALTVDQAEPVLTADGMARLGRLYPAQAGVLSHALCDHPLLRRDMLAMLAERMDPALVECRAANNRNGAGFAMADPAELGAAETIRQIDHANRWVMLNRAETLPEFGDLLGHFIAEIGPILTANTGEPLQPHAFIFISSPGTLTPFHFDPEFNILFQIAGTKHFATCPPKTPWLEPAALEKYHSTGDNLLPWHDGLVQGATVHTLHPGEAVFVPNRAPHWVEVGRESPSISLSLTWRSQASLAQDQAWRLTAKLRQFGIASAPPPLPHNPFIRAGAMRVLDRLGLG